MAAHLHVVRSAVRLVEENDAHASPAIVSALHVVERWLAGATVEPGALETAAQAAWTDGFPFRMSSEPSLRARMWLATAAGNLASMATAARGWKNAPRTILDAAAAAVSSLRIDALPTRADFEKLATEELARHALAPAAAKTKAPPRPRRLASLDELGPLANAFLVRRKAIRDPRETADRATLSALLTQRGLPVTEATLAFEERYGGIRFAEPGWGEGDGDIVVGCYALLKNDASTPDVERGFVPIALTPGDLWYLLAPDGTAWVHDTIEEAEPVPFAPSAAMALTRLVLFTRIFHDRAALGAADFDGLRGTEFAAALGLPLLTEASDEDARFWGDARSIVVEHGMHGEPMTTVVGSAAKKPLG